MKFSDRIGATTPSLKLHISFIPSSLQNSLWNFLLETYNSQPQDKLKEFNYHVAKNFRKSKVDELPTRDWERKEWLKSYFYSLSWYELYNFLEFVHKTHYFNFHHIPGSRIDERKKSQAEQRISLTVNKILEDEHSGYRFIANVLSPITNEIEVKSIEEAYSNLSAFGLEGSKKHIENALDLFSSKPNPDYKNSIKESISAIESIAKIIGTSKSNGLSAALDALNAKVPLHTSLKLGFEKIYGYTSDEGGIRHAMLEDNQNVGFDEAKYMLVACSAFASYLLSKADKAGVIKS